MTMIAAGCLLLTAGLVAYIFTLPPQLESSPEKTRAVYLQERKEQVYENLRDLKFEYKAGKMPESDYQNMRTAMEEEAAAILAEMQSLERPFVPAPKINAKAGKLKGAKG
jgi:hypothetical protein